MATTCEAGTIDTLAGSGPAGGGADRRLVADQDQPVVGVTPGMVEGAGDDLGHAVVAAHRVDRDANPVTLRSQRHGLRSGHRVSARCRLGRRRA